MVYFKGVLSVVLACLIHAHSVPLSHSDEALDSYSLKFVFNTTTTVYNGTDLSKPLALSNLQLWSWSDGSPRMANIADALHDSNASLPTAYQFAVPQLTASTGAVKGDLPLVFSHNQTEMIIVGPKRNSGVLTKLQLKIWAGKQ